MTVDSVITGFYQPYRAARASGDAEALSSLFSPEAVLVAPERLPIRGRTAIRAFFAARPAAEVAIDFDRVLVTGDTALVDGIAHWEGRDGHRGATFFDVLKRVEGRWLCVMGGWNSAAGFDVAAAA